MSRAQFLLKIWNSVVKPTVLLYVILSLSSSFQSNAGESNGVASIMKLLVYLGALVLIINLIDYLATSVFPMVFSEIKWIQKPFEILLHFLAFLSPFMYAGLIVYAIWFEEYLVLTVLILLRLEGFLTKEDKTVM